MTVSTIAAGREVISPDMAAFARWVSVLEPASILAGRIADTDFVPKAMRGNAAAITACIMYGDEIGIGPMQSLASINPIEGKPSPSSELLRALIFRAGHHLRVVALDGKRCTLAGKRRDEADWTEITWTEEMARNAGLFNKGTWSRYPRAMLLARCSSELARIKFPDVVKGLGHIADDEATAEDFESWAQVEQSADAPIAPVTRTVERRRPTLPPGRPPVGDAEAVRDDGARPSGGDIRGPHPAPPEGAPAPYGAPPDAPLPDPDGPLPSGPPSDPGGPLPDADDAQPDVPVGDKVLRAVMVGFDRIECTNRALRLAISSAIIGRPLASAKDLTRREGLRLIGALSDLETGATSMEIYPDGTVRIIQPEETQL